MGEKIGYPDQWMDYSGLEHSDSYVNNVRSASAYSFIHGPNGLDKIGQPVNPDNWFVAPRVVNAFYDPTKNEMVFPAAILQPPFFDPNADPSINYGTIGWLIGHEMTHGFKDRMGLSCAAGAAWTAVTRRIRRRTAPGRTALPYDDDLNS
jgi:putative endopeptidase